VLTGISPARVNTQLRAYTEETGELLPLRGIIEDCSPAISQAARSSARWRAGACNRTATCSGSAGERGADVGPAVSDSRAIWSGCAAPRGGEARHRAELARARRRHEEHRTFFLEQWHATQARTR